MSTRQGKPKPSGLPGSPDSRVSRYVGQECRLGEMAHVYLQWQRHCNISPTVYFQETDSQQKPLLVLGRTHVEMTAKEAGWGQSTHLHHVQGLRAGY